jgi:3-polyprenyl-4-hydroxybenzoate decarboxylase
MKKMLIVLFVMALAVYSFPQDAIVLSYQLGDVNRDGDITMEDANQITRYVVGLDSLDNEQLVLGNVNFDTLDNGSPKVNLTDAILIGRTADNRPPPNIASPNGTSAVEESLALVEGFQLFQNFPNPFNPSTTIAYNLPSDEVVKLAIYDIAGHEVAVLVNSYETAGLHKVVWNALNLPTGMYFCKIQFGEKTETRRMTLSK